MCGARSSRNEFAGQSGDPAWPVHSRMDADAKPPLLPTMLALLPAMRTRGCLVTRQSPVLLPSLKATITTSAPRNMSKPAPRHKDATYHTECTGQALDTVKAHSSPSELTLFGACFCPFVHRVWIALEYLQAPYQYREVDPYKKPADLLELNPKGLVPALKLSNGKGLAESTVILEYIDEKYGGGKAGKSLLPPLSDAYDRAVYRLAVDKVNRTLIPSFYRYLQAQEVEAQLEGAKEFTTNLADFVRSMPGSSGFWNGQGLSIVDCTVAPWLYRATNVLRHFRGFEPKELLEPELFERWESWSSSVFEHEAFKATTSTDDLYLDSYVRYSQNRPMTSQVADAINKGRGLP
ncbi:hypothetical protein L1887_61988 [Cichorium endivia]|nr:hypothetical protein L1887_61988 [Cichorium endivia]